MTGSHPALCETPTARQQGGASPAGANSRIDEKALKEIITQVVKEVLKEHRS